MTLIGQRINLYAELPVVEFVITEALPAPRGMDGRGERKGRRGAGIGTRFKVPTVITGELFHSTVEITLHCCVGSFGGAQLNKLGHIDGENWRRWGEGETGAEHLEASLYSLPPYFHARNHQTTARDALSEPPFTLMLLKFWKLDITARRD
ncbi:hypothetical protein E2C01_078211 [Portunus trituberculatus]|uniref:Uncharacterized protein n=1 Tax=Portunus trituberculatus TaxID=210409 RepID=A0A5B7IN87_PORTR|nr:hypothetical protein [Portunus trituberculatus]